MRIDKIVVLWVAPCFLARRALSIDDEHETTTTMVRRPRELLNTRSNRLWRRSTNSCVAVVFDIMYEDYRVADPPLACELQGDDLNGEQYKMVRIKDLTSRWARKNNITSGETTIFVPAGAEIADQTNELFIPSGATIKLGRVKRNTDGFAVQSRANVFNRDNVHWNRNLAAEIRTVLVIRIVTKDAETTATEAELADKIFGANGDAFTLKSLYYHCSNGEMVMQPISTDGLIGPDGVYTVYLPDIIASGKDASDIVDAAIAKATKDLGQAPSMIANHVMFCIPPGTGNWIAYASVNHWQSAYNDKWCTYPSSNLHEVGHNLGLDHAGIADGTNAGTIEYGDKSGFMGFASAKDDGPVMCYNAANMWQLGWYSNYHVDLPVAGNLEWSGALIGFAAKDYATSSDRMTLRIRDSIDYYIHFNNQYGMNSGTRLGGDKIFVTTRAPGLGPAQSSVIAQLDENESYSLPIVNSANVALTVHVITIDLVSIPAKAIVRLRFGAHAPATTLAPIGTTQKFVPATAVPVQPNILPTHAEALRPTKIPTTKAPISAPTKTPSTALSRTPTITLTWTNLIQSPTKVPILRAKTRKPTKAPSLRARTRPPTPSCNMNGFCELGETCVSCPFDCRGGFSGHQITSPYCCIGGACAQRCNTESGWRCL